MILFGSRSLFCNMKLISQLRLFGFCQNEVTNSIRVSKLVAMEWQADKV